MTSYDLVDRLHAAEEACAGPHDVYAETWITREEPYAYRVYGVQLARRPGVTWPPEVTVVDGIYCSPQSAMAAASVWLRRNRLDAQAVAP